jgi:hypothetical protein
VAAPQFSGLTDFSYENVRPREISNSSVTALVGFETLSGHQRNGFPGATPLQATNTPAHKSHADADFSVFSPSRFDFQLSGKCPTSALSVSPRMQNRNRSR